MKYEFIKENGQKYFSVILSQSRNRCHNREKKENRNTE